MRVAGELAQALAVALEAGVAPQRFAARAETGRRRCSSGGAWRGARVGRVGVGLGERRARGAGAEHEALGERVGGQPVGAVQPGAGALADGVEPRRAWSAPSRSVAIPPIM